MIKWLRIFISLSFIMTHALPSSYAQQIKATTPSRLSLTEELARTWNKTRTYRELVKKFKLKPSEEAYLSKYLKERSLFDRHPDPLMFDIDDGSLHLKIGQSKATIKVLSFYPVKILYNKTFLEFAKNEPFESIIKKLENSAQKNSPHASIPNSIWSHLLPKAYAQTAVNLDPSKINPATLPNRESFEAWLKQQKALGMTDAQAQENIKIWKESQPTPWTNAAIVAGSAAIVGIAIYLGIKYFGDEKKEEENKPTTPTETPPKAPTPKIVAPEGEEELINKLTRYHNDLGVSFNCNEAPKVDFDGINQNDANVDYPYLIQDIEKSTDNCCNISTCKQKLEDLIKNSPESETEDERSIPSTEVQPKKPTKPGKKKIKQKRATK